MIIEITVDMIPFLLVIAVLILGFSGAFYILFTPTGDGADQTPEGFADFKSTLLSTFLMMLGDFDINDFRSTPYSNVLITMFCVYQVLHSPHSLSLSLKAFMYKLQCK
jgi:hypothetical protein